MSTLDLIICALAGWVMLCVLFMAEGAYWLVKRLYEALWRSKSHSGRRP